MAPNLSPTTSQAMGRKIPRSSLRNNRYSLPTPVGFSKVMALGVLFCYPHSKAAPGRRHQYRRFRLAYVCVLRQALNSVSLPFKYPIPCCENAIDDFGDSTRKLFFLSFDARSGYHQIAVRSYDQDKLAFFSPGNKNRSRKTPGFYTYLMHVLSTEWNALFKSQYRKKMRI